MRRAEPLLAAAALLVAGLLSPGPAHAAVLHVLLGATQPESVEVQAGGREVLLILRGPLSRSDAQRLSATGGLVEGVTIGDGAVRFRLSEPVEAAIKRGSNAALVLTTRSQMLTASEPWEQRRLLILEAQAAARQGRTGQARDRLGRALAEQPGDVDLSVALAELEGRSGDWRRGLSLYDAVLEADPGAAEVARARRALAMNRGPRLNVDSYASFAPRGERTQGVQLRAAAPLVPDWALDASVETQRGAARNVARQDGLTGGPLSVTRTRGEIGVSREWGGGGGAVTRAGLFAAEGGPGAFVQHNWQWFAGQTTLSGDYRRPYWESLTALQNNARRDAVALQHEARLAEGLVGQAGLGFARYGVPGRSDLSSGPTVNAALTWTLPLGDQLEAWNARLSYRFAAEYLSDVEARSRPLLDVREREVHALTATAEGPVGPGLLTATGGYAVDRFGGRGPIGTLRYARAETPGEPLSFGLETGVGPSLARQSQSVWRIGAFLLWRLGMRGR
ncbi:tetratricopeptide repeat protein [Muricoccus radiodurans]|uniref:tetratricopeptide repeat protein n=1 Tax=Muricoccus radiodurans TaxID=2231721 RepID=UPI003CE74353